jgi:hypothetical protein
MGVDDVEWDAVPAPADYAPPVYVPVPPPLLPEAMMTQIPKEAVDKLTSAFQKGHLTSGGFAIKVVCVTLLIAVMFTGFIACFFFFLASQVEKDIVQSSTVDFVSGLLDDVATYVSPDTFLSLRKSIAQMPLPDFAAQDASVLAANAALKKKAIGVLILCGIVALVLVFAMFFGSQAAQKHRLGSSARPGTDWPNGFSILFVALTCFGGVAVAEVFFLYTVIAQYKPLQTNAVKKAIIDRIIRHIQALAKP